ncbi:MAG: hypothetical protein EOO65_01565 [Methanosarcinales archaeon]|nr:MAG: hypothetical protein EOO65_01565 [Methanosarcinales archaeon]
MSRARDATIAGTSAPPPAAEPGQASAARPRSSSTSSDSDSDSSDSDNDATANRDAEHGRRPRFALQTFGGALQRERILALLRAAEEARARLTELPGVATLNLPPLPLLPDYAAITPESLRDAERSPQAAVMLSAESLGLLDGSVVEQLQVWT